MCNATSVGRFGQGGPVRGTYINTANGDAITINSNRHVGIYGAYNTSFGLFVNGSLYASTIIASTITASTITGYATLANLSTLSTSMENYATKANLSTLSTSLAGYATLDNLSTLSTSLENYVTKDNISTLSTSLNNYLALSNLSSLRVSTLTANTVLSLIRIGTSSFTTSTASIIGNSFQTNATGNPQLDVQGGIRVRTTNDQGIFIETTTAAKPAEMAFKYSASGTVGAIGLDPSATRGMFIYYNADVVNITATNRNVSINASGLAAAAPYKLYVNGNMFASSISTHQAAVSSITAINLTSYNSISTTYNECRYANIQSTLTISTGMMIGTTSTAGYLLNANGGDINITNGVLRINNAQQVPVSDERIKENISSISLETCLSTLDAVPMRTYNFRADYAAYAGMPVAPQIGVIAQEIADIFPGSIQKIPQYGFEDLNFINYNQLYLNTVGATKYLIERDRANTSTIQGMQQQINVLNSFLMNMHGVPSII
jgi:hypothetical protein